MQRNVPCKAAQQTASLSDVQVATFDCRDIQTASEFCTASCEQAVHVPACRTARAPPSGRPRHTAWSRRCKNGRPSESCLKYRLCASQPTTGLPGASATPHTATDHAHSKENILSGSLSSPHMPERKRVSETRFRLCCSTIDERHVSLATRVLTRYCWDHATSKLPCARIVR